MSKRGTGETAAAEAPTPRFTPSLVGHHGMGGSTSLLPQAVSCLACYLGFPPVFSHRQTPQPVPMALNTFSLVIVQHKPSLNKNKRNHSDLFSRKSFHFSLLLSTRNVFPEMSEGLTLRQLFGKEQAGWVGAGIGWEENLQENLLSCPGTPMFWVPSTGTSRCHVSLAPPQMCVCLFNCVTRNGT